MHDQALQSNLTDARQTERNMEYLIGWHERERAFHETAITILRKSLAFTRDTIDRLAASCTPEKPHV